MKYTKYLKLVTFITPLFIHHGVLGAQTLELSCIGTKTKAVANEKKVVWESFVQTYLIVDGRINNIKPNLLADDLLMYQLTSQDDVSCQNYCHHRVEVNGRTNQVVDTNFSIRNGIKQEWEFRGVCSQK